MRAIEPAGNGAPHPFLLDALEQRFWLDLWHAPVLDAIEEERIEVRWYGPVQAMVVAGLPEEPRLNLVLGATEPGAVEEGHLAAAIEWVESRGADFRVPITLELGEAAGVEDLLNQRGYERAESRVRLVRDARSPDFPEPPGIEVDELSEPAEGFSNFITDGFGMGLGAGSLFDCLPGRDPWRCYFAVDEDEHCVGSAATMLHYGIAQLGFAATEERSRGKGVHMALLHRRIVDAAAAGCHTLFAETIESPLERDECSAGCRNLVRAGFKQASARVAWRPPRGRGEEAESSPTLTGA